MHSLNILDTSGALAETGAQITGIVVLGIVLLALAATLIFFAMRKRRNRINAEQDAAAAAVDAGDADFSGDDSNTGHNSGDANIDFGDSGSSGPNN